MRLPDIALRATKTQKLVSARTHNSLIPISPLICLVVVCSLVVIAIEILLGLRLLGKNLTRAQPNRPPSPPPPPRRQNSNTNDRAENYTLFVEKSNVSSSLSFRSSWTAKLLVTPSKLVLFTGIGLLSICFFIFLIILLLHLKEKVSSFK